MSDAAAEETHQRRSTQPNLIELSPKVDQRNGSVEYPSVSTLQAPAQIHGATTENIEPKQDATFEYTLLLRQLQKMTREVEEKDAVISQLKNMVKSNVTRQTKTVELEDRGSLTPSSDNESEYVSFGLNGENGAKSSVDGPALINHSVEVIHPLPVRPATNPILKSGNETRNVEEMRLLESLNDALRNSLQLEHDLLQARSEIADLRGMVNDVVRKQDAVNTPVSIRSVGHTEEHNQTANHSQTANHNQTSNQNLAVNGQYEVPDVSPSLANRSILSNRSKSFEKANSSEIIDELEKLLAEAEQEVAKLKGNAPVLGPSAMPDVGRFKISRQAQLYYKLEMDKVDELGVSELGNLIKNILLQLEIPFSRLPEQVASLNSHLQSEDAYMHFANDVHMALYDDQMNLGPVGSADELYCLGEMVGRVQKLVRASERRHARRQQMRS
ncbi:septation initiation-domain-containing protein [Lipomyces arxii]|uniref:septation initiation-domain-containing protein n=1 Tax=Lipomyces arxii TaxID=56418 RepID=UPI0034CE8A26